MSLLTKFKRLNNFILNDDYYKLSCCEKKIGFVHRKVAKDILQNIKGLSLLNGTLYFDSHNKIEPNKVALNIAELLVKQKNLKIIW